MSKKVNITRDVESRMKIAHGHFATAKVAKAEKETPKHEQEETEKEVAITTPGAVPTTPEDKKSGRKTAGKP